MKTIIILNGPPNSGKDMIANEFEQFGFGHMRFKTGLYKYLAMYYGRTPNGIKAMCSNRVLKEKSNATFGGKTPRQALIEMSEVIIKPLFGKQHFGELLAIDIKKSDKDVIIISDGGFEDELLPLHDVGEVIVVRLSRPGCSFDGDSRSYLEKYDYSLVNDGTKDDAFAKTSAIIKDLTESI
jgi:hypothetical protein